MSKGCQNRGCKKLARHPSRFCSFHTVLEAPVVPPCLPRKKSPSFSSNINSLLPYRKQKTVAYCQNYSLSHFDQCCLEAIQSIISDSPPATCRHLVGVRRLVPLPAPVLEKIMPLLLSRDESVLLHHSTLNTVCQHQKTNFVHSTHVSKHSPSSKMGLLLLIYI